MVLVLHKYVLFEDTFAMLGHVDSIAIIISNRDNKT